MRLKNNYFVNAFFWSTLQKILNALVGFLTVPLLLTYFGKEQYGIISIATACNAYMHLLDLGMNQGAVRQFTRWRTTGEIDIINRVARTNLTFYSIIAGINILILIVIAVFGETLFSTTHEQYVQLRSCLLIIALFNILNWGTTSFNQLLISAKKIAFTAQMHCIQTVLKLFLIGCVFWFHLTLTSYFFGLTALTASLIFPYAYKCCKDKLIDHIIPAFFWKDFKVVLTFSLSLFALSLFQMTATQSRPIILAMFAEDGAIVNTEFRIIEVIPHFLITLGATFSGIFLPKATELVTLGSKKQIESFVFKWTKITTVTMNVLCIPFILCAKEVLSAYVGPNYNYLSSWMTLWCITVIIQMHTTPANSLILGYGKTKVLVFTTAITCILSMIINGCLCKDFGVGSAVLGYFIYVIMVIGMYYIWHYKRILKISRWKMTKCFIGPTSLAILIMLIILYIPLNFSWIEIQNERLKYITICAIKSTIWFIPYILGVTKFKIININDLKRITK